MAASAPTARCSAGRCPSEAAAGAEEAAPPQPGYDPHQDDFASDRTPAAPAETGSGGGARPPRPPPRRRAGAPARRLGTRRARPRPRRPGAQLLLPLLVPGRDRGDRERPDGGRRPARLQPLRRAAPGRADDHAGDSQRGARSRGRSTCSASIGSRATRASACSPTRSASSRRTPRTPSACSRDEGRLAIVFPEGQKGSRKVLWQRYRLRRFGRGGFVRTALRAGVPIVPIALVGGEEAMPIFAHMRLAQRISGLIYFPLNHAFPHFGLAAGAMYLPAKFRIRFLRAGRPLRLPARDDRRRGGGAIDRRADPRPDPVRARLDARRPRVGVDGLKTTWRHPAPSAWIWVRFARDEERARPRIGRRARRQRSRRLRCRRPSERAASAGADRGDGEGRRRERRGPAVEVRRRASS